MAERDEIHLAGVELSARLGVPDAERAAPQRLTLFLTLRPTRGLAGLKDDLANTVDYSAVRKTALALAAERPRRLLETLAEDLARGVLRAYPACESVDVELRKYALPDTDYVAVRLARRRPPPPALQII